MGRTQLQVLGMTMSCAVYREMKWRKCNRSICKSRNNRMKRKYQTYARRVAGWWNGWRHVSVGRTIIVLISRKDGDISILSPSSLAHCDLSMFDISAICIQQEWRQRPERSILGSSFNFHVELVRQYCRRLYVCTYYGVYVYSTLKWYQKQINQTLLATASQTGLSTHSDGSSKALFHPAPVRERNEWACFKRVMHRVKNGG